MTFQVGDLVVSKLVPVPKQIGKITDIKQENGKILYQIHITRDDNWYWVAPSILRYPEPEELI